MNKTINIIPKFILFLQILTFRDGEIEFIKQSCYLIEIGSKLFPDILLKMKI
jgi:hypothetical protein